MEHLEKFIDEYIEDHGITESRMMDFRDELNIREIINDIVNLLQEHCDKGFKEWEKWSDEYDDGYPSFIQLYKIRMLDRLMSDFNVRPY